MKLDAVVPSHGIYQKSFTQTGAKTFKLNSYLQLEVLQQMCAHATACVMHSLRSLWQCPHVPAAPGSCACISAAAPAAPSDLRISAERLWVEAQA